MTHEQRAEQAELIVKKWAGQYFDGAAGNGYYDDLIDAIAAALRPSEAVKDMLLRAEGIVNQWHYLKHGSMTVTCQPCTKDIELIAKVREELGL